MTRRHATDGLQDSRVRRLNDRPPARGEYVLYWMQQSQRADLNHALEYAIRRANDLGLPVLVAFGLMDGYPGANARHYQFLLEGLQDASRALEGRGIRMTVRHGRPDDVALSLSRRASLVVCDRGYLEHQVAWRRRVAKGFGGEVVEVESDSVVPVEVASDKQEVGARTLRPKIQRRLDEFLVDLKPTAVSHDSVGLERDGLDLDDPASLLDRLDIDRSVPAVPFFRGGTTEARGWLRYFLRRRLDGYAGLRGRPESDCVSHMSKYLHFGQISPIEVALAVRGSDAGGEDRGAYLEELIVRRELANNFVRFAGDYDHYSCLPAWARASLEEHASDPRPHAYGRAQLEAAATHDPYWNAAMLEMKHTGYMHNHMRMYWGKKILEWGRDPEWSYRVALGLNNKYFLDGRDPASFANVAWVFGLHDRPWPERAVFGKVRSMTAAGLERKADMAGYIERVDELVRKAEEA